MSGLTPPLQWHYSHYDGGLYPCMFMLRDPDFSYERPRPRTSLVFREQVAILRTWCTDQFGPRSTAFHRGRWWTPLVYKDKSTTYFGFAEAEATAFKMRWY